MPPTSKLQSISGMSEKNILKTAEINLERGFKSTCLQLF